jgi:hypothetical protein
MVNGRRYKLDAAMTVAVGMLFAAALAGSSSAQQTDASTTADITLEDKRDGRAVFVDVGIATVDPAARALLADPARDAADASGLPLLVPADAGLLASAVVTSGEGWIAASMQSDGLHVVVHGLAIAVERPGLASELAGALEPIRVSQSHAIWTVSFESTGVAWSLDLECAQGPRDPRCQSADAARSLAATLVAVTSGTH